jgi:hypothetical protein
MEVIQISEVRTLVNGKFTDMSGADENIPVETLFKNS